MGLLVFCSTLVLLQRVTFAFHQPCCSNHHVRLGNSRLRMSIPNGIDTLTSGLASILRIGENGLAGVTVSSNAKAKEQIRLKLYDIENSNRCRIVRELITELDLVVDQIIPATAKSRAIQDATSEMSLPKGAEAPCLVASFPDSEDKVISGASDIMSFLKNTFSDRPNDGDLDSEPLQQVIRALSPVGLFLASALRTGRGIVVSPAVTSAKRVNRPQKSLILYSYEGNQFCRLVREVLTELDIVYELRSAGKGSPRRSELAERTGGSTQCPYLVDPNTGTEMAESADIIRYLYETYALWTPPSELLEWTSLSVMPLFKPIFSYLAPIQARSDGGDEGLYDSEIGYAIEEINDEASSSPVVIYTYELSPFSSETKSLLDSLKVQYKEISLGKEWIPGLLSPCGAIKRAALMKMTGQSSLPHVFIRGKPIGGLFSGQPGILSLLKEDKFMEMVRAAAN